MQKISINEFKEYCDKISPNDIIFSYENQNLCNIYETLKMSLVFHELKISFNPNIISMSDGIGSVSFERVKHIKVYEPSLLGVVFGVVCGDQSNNKKDRTYKIVVRLGKIYVN